MCFLQKEEERERKLEFQRVTKLDYYLAQIAMEIRRVLSNKPNNFHIKDCLLEFEFKETDEKKPDVETEKPKTLDQEDAERKALQEKMNRSKAAWLGFVGLAPEAI